MVVRKSQSLASHKIGVLAAQWTKRVFPETPQTAGWEPRRSAFRLSSRPSMLVGVESRDVTAVGPLVEELGVGLDQADELLAADRKLLRVLTRVLGDQLHNVVVVDDGGGKKDELEVEVVDLGLGRLARRALLLLETLSGFEVDAAEG